MVMILIEDVLAICPVQCDVQSDQLSSLNYINVILSEHKGTPFLIFLYC